MNLVDVFLDARVCACACVRAYAQVYTHYDVVFDECAGCRELSSLLANGRNCLQVIGVTDKADLYLRLPWRFAFLSAEDIHTRVVEQYMFSIL